MKLRLSIQSGSLAGRELEVSDGAALLLGRGPDCGVAFNGTDADVSRRHALVQAETDGFRIVDQGSRNGTFVNGRRIERARLVADDVIRLGRRGPILRAVIEGAPAAEAVPTGDGAPTTGDAAPRGDWRETIRTFGFYNPLRDKGQPTTRQDYGLAVCLGMMALGGVTALVSLLLGAVGVGPVPALIGVFTALLPAPLYLFLWLWLDRYEPEPAWALTAAFLWGAGFATLTSYIGNSTFSMLMGATFGQQATALTGVISAPLIEEGTKGLGLVILLLALRRHFDGVVDGIVYAGVIALGFAIVEDSIYYGRSLGGNQGSATVLLMTFVTRGVLTPFAHSIFTAMTGIGCGIARESHNRTVQIAAPIAGFAGAVFLHALFNGVLAILPGLSYYIFYFLVWVPFFFAFLGGVAWLLHREARIVRRMLDPEVRTGLITREQLDQVSSVLRRLSWLSSALFDFRKVMIRRQFIRTLTRLGFCHWHVERARGAGAQTVSLPQIPVLRAEVKALQAQL